MEKSTISGQALTYKMDQVSASVKVNQAARENETTAQLSVTFSRFRVNVSTDAFEKFNKQETLLEETFLSKLRDLKSESDQALLSHPLLGEEGEWGVKKTSARISDFVLNGAKDDLEMLKAGREGVLQGFRDAEEAWGGKLPDISYETLEKSLEAIDERIRDLGGSVVDLSI